MYMYLKFLLYQYCTSYCEMSALLPTLLTSLQLKFVKNYLSFLNGVLRKRKIFLASVEAIEAVQLKQSLELKLKKRLMWLIFVVTISNVSRSF